MRQLPDLVPAAASGLGLLVLLAWDRSAGDLLLAGLAGGAQGFALRDHWILTTLLHDGGRRLSWAVMVLLCIGIWKPFGPLRRLEPSRRLQLAAGSLAAVLAVSTLKAFNATSCPWDLDAFGGFARHLGHWNGFLQADGGGGHCFPAGHASAGFGFVAGYFAWRPSAPHIARRWLAAAVLTGLGFGLAQQWRGAHFMSHTLWTGWLCWNVGWLTDLMHRLGSPRGAALATQG